MLYEVITLHAAHRRRGAGNERGRQGLLQGPVHEGQPGSIDEIGRNDVFQREHPAEFHPKENIERKAGEVYGKARIPGPFHVGCI